MRASIQLSSGRFFDFTSFEPHEIKIEDIACALAKLCRFTGHCNAFYSVAQHSVIVSKIVPPEHALAALLHDASEAYINDLSRPLKQINPEYVDFEHNRLWPAVAAAFKLPRVLPACVKEADNIALVTERRDLMPLPEGMADEWHWAKDIVPLPEKIVAIEDWRHAKFQFLGRYCELISARAA